MRYVSGGAFVEPGAMFSCSVSRVDDHVTVGVIGEIDQAAAGQFRNHLLTLAKEHPAVIAIDLTGVSLPDSACVAVLVEAWRFAQDHGIELTVRSPSDAITRAFDVSASGRLLTLRT
ncbi:MAG TPA: STAS domain-containing protein [Acidimicrobiia bacterium]|nr:STAS domain-containing protein [Acidimicrobiia bacterium]